MTLIRETGELPALAIGQVWQCRSQTFHVRILGQDRYGSDGQLYWIGRVYWAHNGAVIELRRMFMPTTIDGVYCRRMDKQPENQYALVTLLFDPNTI